MWLIETKDFETHFRDAADFSKSEILAEFPNALRVEFILIP